MKIKIIILSIIGLAATSLLGIYLFSDNVIETTALSSKAEEVEVPPTLYPSLNGQMLEESKAYARPSAIVIENHPDSRPQAGLTEADIIYETLAEGGITRFLAIFQSSNTPRIGPVRSARPYLANIAQEYQALFAHVGGSDEVLDALKANKYPKTLDANEYYLEKYFGRDKNKAAPHNVYTSIEKLKKLLEDKKQNKKTTITPWKFQESELAGNPTNQIQANFSTKDFLVKFNYNPSTKTYTRILAGTNHKDEAGKQIAPKNVIVLLTDITDIPGDPKLRVKINTENGGKAHIFRDGKIVKGTWKKTNNRTKFLDSTNNEIALIPGQIWIMILANTPDAVTWQASPN